jgi:pimeloyl-ACP methyl ester carboxylesterase
MNANTPCGQECAPACATDCPIHNGTPLEPIHLDEARERFRREATRGVCDTGRYRMPYYAWGEGPPLVFIHGVSDRKEGFVMPVSRLAARFRCVAYDLPVGRGDGAALWRYTHDHLVDDLFALLDHLGLRQAYLLGSSFGSTVALKALHREPGRLPRAVLQGGFARRRLRWLHVVLAGIGRLLPGPSRRLPLRDRIAAKLNRDAFDGRPDGDWEYLLDCTGRTPISAFARQALMLWGLDLRPLLPAIRQPVLLLCGDRDRVVPEPYARVLQDGLPNAGRVLVQGCGHVPSYSHPELMAEIVGRFFTPPVRDSESYGLEQPSSPRACLAAGPEGWEPASQLARSNSPKS